MKKITLLFLSFVLFCSTALKAQQWDTVAKFNQVIEDLQTFNGNLFIAGGFTKNGTNNCYWSAYYTGSNIVCQSNTIGGSGIRKLDVFNGTDLYSADALDHGGVMGVGLWGGSTWQNGGSTNYSHSVVYADGNDLYVVSDDGKVRKKTGSGSFQLFYDFAGSGGISSICRYNTKLIFAGSFTSINGVAANNIAQWNGTTWQALGAGISTGGVRCMAVLNNELYVAGKFSAAGGTPVTNIAKWNGTSWSAVGGGVTGTSNNGIRDMKSYGTNLYVVGDFTQMGSVNTKNVAKWDGTQWAGLGLTHYDSFVNCVEIYNGQLYVGTFDFAHSHVFHLSGYAGINEFVDATDINVYPTPSNGTLTIESVRELGEKTELEIYNVVGEKIYSINNTPLNNTTIDLSNQPNGIYFITIKTEEGVVTKKVIINK